MTLNPSFTILDTLKQAQNEGVTIAAHLRSGLKFEGKVGGVGEHHVIVAKLVAKEFFDALVRIDDISALEVRARSS